MAQRISQEELLNLIKEAARSQQTELNLSGLGIIALPPDIGQLVNLQDLDLQNNQLTALPAETVIQFNCWDFGGQAVYRVTHQFFFSPRAVYLLLWEPRMGVEQGQVEAWLKLLRLRVGETAKVIVVSTHCRSGERIARIDKPVFQRDFGKMIVAFHEVDSLVPDPATGEMVGVAELKELIAETARGLSQMGMPF